MQATLLELSAATVVDALRAQQPRRAACWPAAAACAIRACWTRIAALLPDAAVESTAAHGLDPDFVEAMAFAWLARQTLAGLPGNVPSVTGARGPRVLGVVYPA